MNGVAEEVREKMMEVLSLNLLLMNIVRVLIFVTAFESLKSISEVTK